MTPVDFLNDIAENIDQNGVLLNSPAFRESLYRQIHPRADRAQLLLLRTLFALECDYRHDEDAQEEDDYAYFENIYWCALFLYQIGDVADVLPMWRAKNINMDTGCGFDAQFMVGAGIEKTCSFLQQSSDPDAKSAFEYLQHNWQIGTFSDLTQWHTNRVAYYADL